MNGTKAGKFTFKCAYVQFFGRRLTKDGLKPDLDSVAAVLNIKKPSDVTLFKGSLEWQSTDPNSLVISPKCANQSVV